MDTPEVITEGMELWVFQGEHELRGMPFRVSHVSKHEIIGVDADGNNRAFNRSVFDFTR